MDNRDQLNMLYKECGLVKPDIHKHQHYTIITRAGIEKIMFAKGITIKYQEVKVEKDFCAVKAIATKDNETIETYGSACKETSHNKYYLEMAEKRAMSRAVLKITKGYQLGVFSEDEADDFKKNNTT